jgi:hypothetical protein
MKSLKQFVLEQELTGENDLKIIERWFIENDMEQEGLKLIADLSYLKANKLQQTLDYARTWMPYVSAKPDQPKYAKKQHYYDRQTETKLIQISQCCILKMPLPDSLFEWAKENIPQMEMPLMYFQPTIVWLEQEYGIKFKGNKE